MWRKKLQVFLHLNRLFHLPAIWITEAQRERAESLGYTVVDAPSIIATHLTEVIRSHIAELLTRQDVQNLVNNLKNPIRFLWTSSRRNFLALERFRKYCRIFCGKAFRSGIFVYFESLADHAQTSRDTDVLTEYVRQSLKRAISSKYFPSNETTSVITLDPKVEQEIMSSVKQTEQGAYLTMDPEKTKQLWIPCGQKPRNSKASERIRSLYIANCAYVF